MNRGAQGDPLGNSMAETIVHREQAENDYSANSAQTVARLELAGGGLARRSLAQVGLRSSDTAVPADGTGVISCWPIALRHSQHYKDVSLHLLAERMT